MEITLLKVFINVAISVVIYFGIATVLILVGKRKKPTSFNSNLAFNELFFDYTTSPELKTFTARDGTQLS